MNCLCDVRNNINNLPRVKQRYSPISLSSVLHVVHHRIIILNCCSFSSTARAHLYALFNCLSTAHHFFDKVHLYVLGWLCTTYYRAYILRCLPMWPDQEGWRRETYSSWLYIASSRCESSVLYSVWYSSWQAAWFLPNLALASNMVQKRQHTLLAVLLKIWMRVRGFCKSASLKLSIL